MVCLCLSHESIHSSRLNAETNNPLTHNLLQLVANFCENPVDHQMDLLQLFEAKILQCRKTEQQVRWNCFSSLLIVLSFRSNL